MQAMSAPHRSDSVLEIGIISYDYPHLKTEQLVHRLLLRNKLANGPKFDIKLLALPFSPRPSREVLLAHRPDQERSIPTRELASMYGLDFAPCTYDTIPDIANLYLVAGAGIFRETAIGRKKILNVHPGIIPSARGLDAFKWSIFEGVPLGVTLHTIDAEVDAGEVLAVVKTPVFPSDTLELLARRHYELELDVLCEFLPFLDGTVMIDPAAYPENPPRMRMPMQIEKEMVAKFDEYRRKFAVPAF
jgi:phosphoribosylglycinamide formyltransferase-1